MMKELDDLDKSLWANDALKGNPKIIYIDRFKCVFFSDRGIEMFFSMRFSCIYVMVNIITKIILPSLKTHCIFEWLRSKTVTIRTMTFPAMKEWYASVVCTDYLISQFFLLDYDITNIWHSLTLPDAQKDIIKGLKIVLACYFIYFSSNITLVLCSAFIYLQNGFLGPCHFKMKLF